MGAGMHAKPPRHNTAHPSYITWYEAMGGWQTQCLFWAGQHWDCWETGRGPYRYRDDAVKEASDWADSWRLELRPGPMGPEELPGLIENLKAKLPEAHIVELGGHEGYVLAMLPTIDAQTGEPVPTDPDLLAAMIALAERDE